MSPVSLNGATLNGAALEVPALQREDVPPPRRSSRCSVCGASGSTVLVGPGLPKPGRYCRPCLTLRDTTLGVQVA